jgi:hypothetical protein
MGELTMFDVFGDWEARNAINAQAVHVAALCTAIVSLLIEKGVITQEEFDRRLQQSTAAVDQLAASNRE